MLSIVPLKFVQLGMVIFWIYWVFRRYYKSIIQCYWVGFTNQSHKIKSNLIYSTTFKFKCNLMNTFQIFLRLPQIEPLHPDPGSIWVNADQGSLDLAPQVLASFHLSNSGRIRDICGYFHPSSCHELIPNCCDWVEQVFYLTG